ncbi:cytochrome P450 [Arthrobacter sp. V4I6]|uniref:cytochrome P450 n=1 Tax=unclassified Arthrobacter TaxID=235627 RepID=UPI0027887874|nr:MULTISPECIES: cytochrome P450 [unclassified Arthrobacter]MDQ0821439.1 cytochrome P450 [Arthrobacter sp. V1I7]MDQ0855705.1 cytochrome P450 [Arthrobacter sp. V4I6]
MHDPMMAGDVVVLDVDPFSREGLTSPLTIDAAIRESAPVVWSEQYSVWFTGRYDVVDQVFRDYETFESSAGTGITNTKKTENWRKPSVILENDPPAHTKYRRIMTSVLSQRVVRRLTDSFQKQADELVDSVVGKLEFNAATELAEKFPLTVLPDAVGFQPEGREHLLPYSNLNFQSMGPRNEFYDAAVAAADEASTFVNWQMRREALVPDGLGHTIYGYVDEGEITEEDAGMLVRTFLSAGVDTTIFAIQFALKALAEHPEAWAALRDDPGLARKVFEEALRWSPPSPYIGRTTSKATELGGIRLGAGEKVIMALAAANRDPRRWDDPDAFDLSRDPSGHMAFGTGIHGCVGQMMARMEATCLLSALARRVETIELAGDPVPFFSNWLRGFEDLPMRVTLR